ncbi:MAG: GNAT family N-acetyltransferase [Nitrospirota bacterium]|nr:GNAT family N-acetyltransferase [Nitrospirota bacterium]
MNHDQDVELKTVTTFNEFLELRHDWNSLLEQSGNDRVFLTHEWFASWWQAFGEGKRLFIIAAVDRDGIQGIAPLMRCQSSFRGIPVRGVEFLSNDDSPGCGFILKKNHEYLAGTFFSFLLNDSKEWDVIFFKNMIHDETINSLMVKVLEQTGKRYIVNPGLSSPYIEIKSEWDEYIKGLSSKYRKTIRNVCNRIKRLGDVDVGEYNDMKGFDDIVSVTEKGWKYREGKAFINCPDRNRFFRLLSEEARNKGWLSIWCVYKGKEPIAYEYHLKYKGCDIALLSEFNSEYKNFSPGSFLDHEIIRSLFVNGVHEYDMCGIHDEYKKKWTNNVRAYKNLIVFNNSVYSRFLHFLEDKPVRFFKRIRDKVTVTGT